ncbi:MAG: TetR/AcrR family transcriptional regulator [Salinarimonas sp.]|nr:TetR/AcrR family transcriptional regulator [Salinarimonas sp.]
MRQKAVGGMTGGRNERGKGARSTPVRTQAERSASTREKILTVTIDLLYRQGLRDTSTVDIAAAAGVSRGALLHHYPTKEELLKEALRFLLHKEIDSIRAMAHEIDDGRLDTDGLFEALWEKFSGPLFMVTLEYVTAARTDPAIRAALQPVAYEFNASLDEIWELFFTESAVTPGERRKALTATLCFMRGMGTQKVWREDPKFFEDMLDFWKTFIRSSIGLERRPHARNRRGGIDGA